MAALDMPFLLLPFRPGSDPVGSKSFIRNFFKIQYEGSFRENKQAIQQELRLMDPLVGTCGFCTTEQTSSQNLTGPLQYHEMVLE